MELKEILKLFRPEDSLAVPLATGQPMALLGALNERDDWKHLEIFTGLLGFPYPILMNPNVYITSGYYGPIERLLNEKGANVDYLPADFYGFELFEARDPSRIVATTLSPPDEEGFLTFGTHGAAVYHPFINACRDPDRIAIAEINKQMPIVYGLKEFGDNKIHMSEVKYCFESDQTSLTPPEHPISDVEKKIAEHVLTLIPDGATLQFGIGAIPNEIAGLLAKSSLSNFGIHSELISDGFLHLVEADKISNKNKGIFPGTSIFTFAMGSQALYDFLDEQKGKNKRQAVCVPVGIVNHPYYISKNENMVSVNSGLMVDFAGQVCSEAIGLRQYSGVGGQLSFVQGAYEAKNGRSIICIKSTTKVNGKKVSNIMPTLPIGSLISTPRHYVQYIITEYGIADLYGVADELRGEKMIAIAHPDFREELESKYAEMNKDFYNQRR